MGESIKNESELQENIYKNKNAILITVLIGILMSVLDGYMVTIALPTITTHFNISLSSSQWIITGYLAVMTGLFIFFGKISEYTGKTKLFIVGWILFTLSSLACGFAASINTLIIFRITQAIGASMVAGVSGAIIFHSFPPNEIGKAMGYFGAVVAIGSLIGPGLGGYITNTIGWQYIFFINVPIGIFLLVCALKYLKIPETTTPHLHLDWIGSISLVILVAALLLFCGELAKNVAISTPLIAYGVTFILALITFCWQESRSENPLLEISIFHNKMFTMPVLSVFIFSVALNMAIVIGPFYLQGVMNYSPSQVGLLFMLVPLAMMFASPLGGRMYDKYHSKYASGLSMLISAISFILLGYGYLIGNIGIIIGSLFLWGIGQGLFTSPNTTETMISLPREKTAIASSVSTTAKSLGGALGVSFASILTLVGMNITGYTGNMLLAGSQLLSNSISTIMFIAGGLCIIATITSILRNVRGV
ncbi:MAG: drug resistance transporter, EmrB/QacA subfamily [Methanobacterium sp. Maddingley MBC34]|nr:MAG: drug resistance transporter, EmrB/QacA subfamily [Methanobacterium sp. Maddingley MBC34]